MNQESSLSRGVTGESSSSNLPWNCWQNSSSCTCKAETPVFLLANSQGLPSGPRGCLQPPTLWPHHRHFIARLFASSRPAGEFLSPQNRPGHSLKGFYLINSGPARVISLLINSQSMIWHVNSICAFPSPLPHTIT